MAECDGNCLLLEQQRSADTAVGIATAMVVTGSYVCLWVFCQVVFQDSKSPWRS
jgi:hypothetical protein